MKIFLYDLNIFDFYTLQNSCVYILNTNTFKNYYFKTRRDRYLGTHLDISIIFVCWFHIFNIHILCRNCCLAIAQYVEHKTPWGHGHGLTSYKLTGFLVPIVILVVEVDQIEFCKKENQKEEILRNIIRYTLDWL